MNDLKNDSVKEDGSRQILLSQGCSASVFNQKQIRQIKFVCKNRESRNFKLDTRTGLTTFTGKSNTTFKVLFQFGLQTKTAFPCEVQSFVNVNNTTEIKDTNSIITISLIPNVKQQVVLHDYVTLHKNDVISLGGFLKEGLSQSMIYSDIYAEFYSTS